MKLSDIFPFENFLGKLEKNDQKASVTSRLPEMNKIYNGDASFIQTFLRAAHQHGPLPFGLTEEVQQWYVFVEEEFVVRFTVSSPPLQPHSSWQEAPQLHMLILKTDGNEISVILCCSLPKDNYRHFVDSCTCHLRLTNTIKKKKTFSIQHLKEEEHIIFTLWYFYILY